MEQVWLRGSNTDCTKKALADGIIEMEEEHHGTLGSRQMMIFINRKYNTIYNHKRIMLNAETAQTHHWTYQNLKCALRNGATFPKMTTV